MPDKQNGDLVVARLSKRFSSAGGTLEVLKGVDLRLNDGDAIAITGPSGSGKSTLLYIIGTLDRPSDGTVRVHGVDPFAMRNAALARYRNANVGFIFQDHHLLPQCTVLENVLIPTLAGSGAGPEERERAGGLLDRVGLRSRLTHRPAQLSGGEKQRVAVCRALINRPTLLLADEPTGNLDRATAEPVASLLLELASEFKTLLLCATHDVQLAARFPRHCELDDGRLVDSR